MEIYFFGSDFESEARSVTCDRQTQTWNGWFEWLLVSLKKNKKGIELGKKLLIIFKNKKYLALCFGFQFEIPFIE